MTTGSAEIDTTSAAAEPSLTRRIAFKSLGGILALPLNMLLQLMVPRALGAAAYGDYSFLSAFFTSVMSFADSGSSQAFYNKVSQRPDETPLYAFYARYAIAVLLAIGALVGFAFAMGVSPLVWPNLPAMLVVLAAVMAFGNWANSVASRAVDANALTARGEVTTIVVRLLLVISVAGFFLARALSVRTFFGLQTFFNTVLLVGLIRVLAARGRAGAFFRSVATSERRGYQAEFWRYCHPLLTVTFAVLLGEIADRWLLQRFAGSAQQGFLGLGLQIGSVVFIFGGALATLLAREFARSHHAKDLDRLRDQFLHFMPRAYAVTAFFGVFFAVQSPAIVRIFGGSQFAPAVTTTAILCLYPLHQVYGQVGNSLLYATDRTNVARDIGLVGIALGLVITYVLIAPRHLGGLAMGSLGIATKMVIHQAIIVNVVLWWNTRYLGVSPWPLIAKQVSAPAVFGACAAGSALLAGALVAQPVLAFLTAGVAYCLFVAMIVWAWPAALGVSRTDIDRISLEIHRARAGAANGRSPRARYFAWARAGLGLMAALICFELGLRRFATPMDDAWLRDNLPLIEPLQPQDTITTRFYQEGFATSHFSPAHRRLTGNAPVASAPAGVILGDSFVEALMIPDSQTVGSVIERDLRESGRPVNVIQFGWPGVPPARYVLTAPQVIEGWRPEWVAVLLNADDITHFDGFPTAQVGPDTALQLIDTTNGFHEYQGWRAIVVGSAKEVLRRSALAYHAFLRLQMIRAAATAPRETPEHAALPAATDTLASSLPRAVVRSLKRSYGSRLIIVYIAEVTLSGVLHTQPESRLLAACSAEGVTCLDTREAMVTELREDRRLARGFTNTVIGTGHLNASGHELTARVIETELRRR